MGAHLYVNPNTWWVGVERIPNWLLIQPLPCVGLAVRWPR